MTEIKCPLCGNPNEENNENNICSDCQQFAENRNKTDFTESIGTIPVKEDVQEDFIDSDSQGSQQTNKNITKKKNHKKKNLLIIISIVAVLATISGGLYFYKISKIKDAKQIELNYWYACIEKNTPLEYSKYLLRYPEGKFQKDALDKIVELRKIELESWLELQKSNNLEDYYAYLSANPESPYKSDIKNRMDSLAWNVALAENTADSYLAYIENVNLDNLTGYYSAMAQERYDYLSQIKNVEGDELKESTEIVKSFFNALSSPKNENLTSLLAPKISAFYGVTNITKESLLKSIEKDKKAKDVKSITYTAQTDSMNIQKDNKGIYLIQLKIEKKIAYKTKTDKQIESILLKLNPQKQVFSLSLDN